MIRIVRIVGESFDLETQREMPKALILSNGKNELPLYVDDEIAEAVLMMMKDGEPPARLKAPSPRKVEPAVKPSSAVHEEVGLEMATVGELPPPDTDDDNSGFEPGEEYNDPATGAESL